MSKNESNKELARLREIDREVYLLSHVSAVLSWDQETYMPERAIDERADQIALVSGLAHQRKTAPEIAEQLKGLGVSDSVPTGRLGAVQAADGDAVNFDAAFVRAYHREYRQASKIPEAMVRAMSELTSKAQAVWVDARKRRDYAAFSPLLQRLVDYNRRIADLLGYSDHPYDALLDQYEQDMTTRQIDTVFGGLRRDLVPLVQKIADRPQVDDAFIVRDFPVDAQQRFGETVLRAIGYDFTRGRLDVSAHPFTTGLGASDVRITTRYAHDFFKTSIFGTIHEAGHALYEMGIGEAVAGTLLGEGTSLGIHESQSRMWENMIGRSRAFWQFFWPALRAAFPAQLADIDIDAWFRAVNKVEPSLIRVEADEVTYNLHIMLRFDLEKRLIDGSLTVDELPEAWRALSREFLGIEPPDVASGVLQDIHWSMGAFGYFPTYALGNLYAAQFYAHADRQIGPVDDLVRSGRFGPILGWLRTNIHQYGRALTADELCRRITGESLDARYFIDYLVGKYRVIYDL